MVKLQDILDIIDTHSREGELSVEYLTKDIVETDYGVVNELIITLKGVDDFDVNYNNKNHLSELIEEHTEYRWNWTEGMTLGYSLIQDNS